ncbi:MAG: cob(I)yrinic acid a,c-diamide adenosyltransferase [Candidatus Abyssubacteria bacterium]
MTHTGEPSQSRGLIHVYTGEGKGKTTAALGMALRAVGAGRKVIMLQFLKTSNRYGELRAALRLAPDFEIVQMGPGCVRLAKDPSADKECTGCMECHVKPDRLRVSDFEAARRGIERAQQCLTDPAYGMVILDEINYAVHFKLIPVEELTELLRHTHPSVEVVLTGRSAHPTIVEMADYVTEMREIKHPWHSGVTARKGIEY